MSRKNCPAARGCTCQCVRNKHIACNSSLSLAHCGNENDGCHANCSPPDGQKAKPLREPKKSGPAPGTVYASKPGPKKKTKCGCKCTDCKNNVHGCGQCSS